MHIGIMGFFDLSDRLICQFAIFDAEALQPIA